MTNLSITIRGKYKQWTFPFEGDVKDLEAYRQDGLEVDEVINSIPEWLPYFLVRPWCFIEDVYNFRFLSKLKNKNIIQE